MRAGGNYYYYVLAIFRLPLNEAFDEAMKHSVQSGEIYVKYKHDRCPQVHNS